ncbi:hypothetical protein [Malikia sp.]|uniref:hypothetical protein n=1 Tax=Malikia sp. TaxID=2070706 RepID=UPI00261DF7B6|nr:hypothetical protein [Malikia sp.]MDD2728896.1 hypothetical protein [Malikia sp.]
MHRSTARRHSLALLLSTLACAAAAQPGARPTQEVKPVIEQKAEQITHEDAGSRIDELRVGGQTRRIEVTTKSALPAYQVQPLDANPQDQSERGAGKSRWRLVDF